MEIDTMSSELSIKSNIWKLMPEDIIKVIFSKLSIVNLSGYRLVCKAWNHLVLDYASNLKFVPNTYFVFKLYNESLPFLGVQSKNMWSDYPRMHCIDFDGKYSHGMNVVASFRFDPTCLNIRVSNSCMGLLCIIHKMNFTTTCVGILNPMTNEYIKLSEDKASKDFDEAFSFYGFGFSSKTMQYKVAKLSSGYKNHNYNVEIFRLGKSNKWNHVGLLPFNFNSDGIYFNGALYWIGQYIEGKERVCCFDVEYENFEIISLPKLAYSTRIGVLNGSLYTTFLAEGDMGYKFEVWTMQNYGRGKDSWMKEFVVDGIPKYWEWSFPNAKWREHLQLIKVCENGEILCLLYGFYLFSHNPKTWKIKTLIEDKLDSFWIYQIESLNFDSLEKILGTS